MPSLFADLTPLRESAEYRRLWAALAVSNIGQQMTSVAVGIQVYDITGSPLAVGFVGFFQLVPLVFFGLYGGALSDSHDRRRIGILTAAGLMLCSAILLSQALVGSTSVALLYAVVAVQSGFFAVGNPALQAMIPRLVGLDLLPAANSLGMLSFNIGWTLGPLFGGLLIGVTGHVSTPYALDVVAFVGTLYATVRLRPMPPLLAAPRTAGFGSVMEGLRFLKGRRNLQMSFFVDIAAMVFGMPRALFPAIAATFYPGTMLQAATIVGLLSAAPAVGAIISGVLSGPLSRIRWQGLVVVVAIVGWGVSIALFGLVHVLWLGLVLLALAGAADNVSAVMRSTILQAASPDEYRGRLQGIFTVVVAGGPRLGDVESGAVATIAGEPFSVVSGGLACLAVLAALVAWSPGFLHYDAHNPSP